MAEPDWRVIALGMPTGIRKSVLICMKIWGVWEPPAQLKGVRSSFADR